jgi:predicted nucleic acid-binding protein
VNVVDSSAWLEYFADGPNASWFASAIETPDELIVPSLTIFEVFKKLATERGDTEALQAVGAMQQGRVVDLDPVLAIGAARIGIKHQLPLADSIILATARAFDATLWTQNSDFQSLPGVEFTPVVR